MTFKFKKFIRNELNGSLLTKFLKENNLSHSGSIEEKIKRVEQFANNTTHSNRGKIEKLLKDTAKFGQRRMIYLNKISAPTIKKFNNEKILTKALSEISPYATSENFNDLNSDKNNNLSEINKDEFILEYLNSEFNDKDQLNIIEKINLCYSYVSDFKHKDEDELEIIDTHKHYLWIEINFKNATIAFHIPSFPEYFGLPSTSNALHTEFSDLIKTAFGLSYLKMDDSNKLLYKVFKDIISVSEKPFKEKMEIHFGMISEISGMLKKNEVLENQSYQFFEGRLHDLIERTIIQENFKEYLEYSEGKDGIISQMQYTDETGASVNATSGKRKKNGTIELCDVFFDTRKTINNNEKVDILWIDWFMEKSDSVQKEGLEKNASVDKRKPTVTTKFVSGKTSLLVHFQRITLTEEVVDYVFSKLRNYQEFRW